MSDTLRAIDYNGHVPGEPQPEPVNEFVLWFQMGRNVGWLEALANRAGDLGLEARDDHPQAGDGCGHGGGDGLRSPAMATHAETP